MAFTAATVLRRANTILQDQGAIRWTPMELRDWLNEAMRTIVTMKPNARSGTVTLTLVAGTRQDLPDEYTILSQVIANVETNGALGRAIRTVVNRTLLDAQIPGWHNATLLPNSATTQLVLQDPMAPREFYVVPGATAGSRVAAIVGKQSVDVPLPNAPGSSVLDIDSYIAPVQMDDWYQSILLDLVLFRAFAKDSASPDAAGRSQTHLTLATNQLVALGTAQDAATLAAAFRAAA